MEHRMATLAVALSALVAAAHAADDGSSSSSSSTTIVILIIVAVVLVLASLLWWCCSRRRMSRKSLEDGEPVEYNQQPDGYNGGASMTSGIGAGIYGPDEGFLASKNTYGSSSVWTDQVLTSSRIPNEQISRHKLIAQSSDAQVWVGSHEGREVVLKQLWGESRNMQAAIQLATQVKTLVGLSHPRIVQVIGAAWRNALDIEVVTEYLPNGDLRALLQSGDGESLTWEETKCTIAIDVAEGLDYLHQQRPVIKMGDVSATNVLLDSTLRAKLSLVRVNTTQTPTKAMAPEVIMGERETDRSDVYAFGLLLSELDTCRPPFEDMKRPDGDAMKQIEVLYGITSGSIQPTFTDECPEPIRALAMKCLALEPEKRPSASQLAYRLRAILKEEL